MTGALTPQRHFFRILGVLTGYAHCTRSRSRPLAQASFHELGIFSSKRTGTTVPSHSLSPVSPNASQSPTREKYGIKSHAHPQRTSTISGLRGALVEQARRGNIRLAKELIALGDKRTCIY
jgi:hypothetical protein